MKKILLLTVLAVLGLFSAGTVRAQSGASATPLVWCGLDYSMIRMIGTQDFRQPDKIFPDMPAAWNALFMKEMLPELESMAKTVVTDLKAVGDRNDKATASQIVREDGTRTDMVDASHINDAAITAAVNGYKLKNENGLGLVFIMDRLVKAQETGCIYVVFFDVGSRKVVLSQRFCTGAGGMGFRNYWFRPIKDTVKKLPAIYKKLKATRKS